MPMSERPAVKPSCGDGAKRALPDCYQTILNWTQSVSSKPLTTGCAPPAGTISVALFQSLSKPGS